MPSADDHRREKEWKLLYEELRQLLASNGRESPYGAGDFWLVDDDWGGHLQKACIFNITFLTKRLVQDIQGLLMDKYPEWGVMLQLEIEHPTATVPPEGLIVYADIVEEAWDTDNLMHVFGKNFVFRLSS